MDQENYQVAKRMFKKTIWETQKLKRQEFAETLQGVAGKGIVFKIAKQMAKDSLDVTAPIEIRSDNESIVFGKQEVALE